MEMLHYLNVLMDLVFFGYVFFILTRYGVLESISSSYYKLPKKYNMLFTLFCWGFALPTAIIGFVLSEGSPYQFSIFIACSGIMFVGSAPDYKFGYLDNRVHTISAIIGVLFSQLFIFLVFTSYWYIGLIACLLILFILLSKMNNKIFWIEIAAYLSTSILYKLMIL